MTDWKLIREYVDKGSERAFSELSGRHMKLVYWTCRRDLVDDQQAEDATQVVFILLAQKARTFNKNVGLSSWLFNTSRLVSRNVRKSAMRQSRLDEKAVLEMERSYEQSRPDLAAMPGCAARLDLEPLINDGLSALASAEREAVLLRFFDGLSLRELADRVGTTEEGARKRVSRAVDKLRRYLVKQEITVSSMVVAALLEECASKSAPAGVHAAVQTTVSSLASSTPAALHSAALLKKGAIIAMNMTTRKILVGSVALVLAAAIGTVSIKAWQAAHASTLSQTEMVTDRSTPLSSTDSSLRSDRQAVLADLETTAAGMRDGDPGWINKVTAPEVQMATKRAGTLSQAGFYRSEAGFYKALQNRQPHIYLISCQFDGDHATAEIQGHMDAVGIAPQFPNNAVVAADSTWALNFEKRNGQWLIVSGQQVDLSESVNGRVLN